jgi:predicted AAA+ superfamily ATPase
VWSGSRKTGQRSDHCSNVCFLRGVETWFGESCALYHYRDKDQDEADLVIEAGSGALVGIEVKASATVNAGDFKGLRKLAEACGDNFKLGVVLYDGRRLVPFGDRLVAAPMSCLWA